MTTRRKFTAQFKAQVVLEILTGAKRPAEVSREYGHQTRIAVTVEGGIS